MKKMTAVFSFIMGVVFMIIGSIASANPADAVVGVWWTADKGARVEISKEGEIYTGKIAWLPEEKINNLDDKNPDKALRTQKIMGLSMLKDFKFDDGQWVGGKIYDPKSGKTYSCKITLDKKDSDKINIRGYIGTPMLGRTEVFSRYKE